MPTSLQKVKKRISKKRGGVVNALHARSRDSKKLHKAVVRDGRLERLVDARNLREQPIGRLQRWYTIELYANAPRS